MVSVGGQQARDAMTEPAVLVVSGIPGVGKSTVAGIIARQLSRSVHLEAEALQRFIAGGSVWLADSFFESGFTPIVDDVVIGSRLAELRADLHSRPLSFVLLVPRLEVVQKRNRERPHKDVFETWRHLDTVTRSETPRIGLWLDTSDQTAERSAAEILKRAWQEAVIDGGPQ